MKKRFYSVSVGLILILLGLCSTAYAALIDRGNGLIYDDVQDITWMSDANNAATTGYDTDGLMTWDAAVAWADQLEYGGYNDWRLFSVDETCSGYNCTSADNELGHLFYVDLGVTQGNSITTSTAPEYNFFSNVQSYAYWSGAEYAPYPGNAWLFGTNDGFQGLSYKADEIYSWAVRTGDVAAVPEPASLFLLISGLLGIAGVRGRGRRL